MSLYIQFKAKTNFNIQVYAGRNQGMYKSVFKNRSKPSRGFPNRSTIQGLPKISKRQLGRKMINKLPRAFRKWSRIHGVSQPKSKITEIPNPAANNQLVPWNNKTTGRPQYNRRYQNDIRTQCLKFRIKLPRGVDPSNLLQFVQYRTKFDGSGWSDNAQLSSLIPNNIDTMEDDEDIPWNDVSPQIIDFSEDDVEIPWNGVSPQFIDFSDDDLEIPQNFVSSRLNDFQPEFPEFTEQDRLQPSRSDEGYYDQEFGSTQYLDDIMQNELIQQQPREMLADCVQKIRYYENMLQTIVREIRCREEMITKISNPHLQTPVFRGVHLAGDGHMLQLAIEVADNVFTGSVPEWGLCASGETIRRLNSKLQESSHIGSVCCVMVGSMDVLRLAGSPESLETSMVDIIEQYCSLIVNLKRNFEQIIWLNLLPIPRMEICPFGRARYRYQEALDEINKFLFTLNDGERILVVDVNKRFIDERGNTKTNFFCRTMGEGSETRLDGVRLNHEGTFRLIDAIETCLSRYSTV